MKEHFSEDEVVTTVSRLTRRKLTRFIDGDLIKPRQVQTGYVFGQIDIARLELLCDLSDDLGLDDYVLGIVISLLDQLHAARQDLITLARVIDTLPADLRVQITTAIKQG